MTRLTPTPAARLTRRLPHLPALALLLLLLLLTGPAAQAQWLLQPFAFPDPTTFAYRFGVADANAVWAVGFSENAPSQVVARTTNGGQQWALRPVAGLGPDEYLTSVAATSAANAWVTAANDTVGGRLLRTTDGGSTWQAQPAVRFGRTIPNFVHFFTALDGVVVADPGALGTSFTVFVTRDGGTTWRTVANVPAALPNEGGTVLAPAVVGNALWFATDEGRVYRTADQGNTWTAAATNTPGELFAVAFADAARGLALSVDNAGDLLAHATADGGLTWRPRTYTGPLFSTGITGVPGSGLLVSVGAGDLGPADIGSSFSRDFGATWTLIENTRQHAGVAAHSRTAVWSGAVQGTAGQTPSGLGVYRLAANVLLSNRPTAAPTSLLAYPNPSPDGAFRLPLPGTAATVRLTNALGQQVRHTTTLANQPELLLDLRDQAPGLYQLTVETAAGASRQRLVVAPK